MFFWLYRFVTFLLVPFLYVLLLVRRVRGFEEAGHMLEKTGRATLPRPKGTLIWVHTVSVGEALSIQPLLDRILAENPDVHCLVTTTTVTAAHTVRRRNNPRILHQYLPLDAWAWVRRFLAHWRVDAVIWVESEIWPEAFSQIHASGVPLMMVNARLSERSAKRWLKVGPVIRQIMGWFDVVLAQTAQDSARLQNLGAAAQVAGNMKFAVAPLGYDVRALEALTAQTHGRPVLLLASTHAGEEEIALQVATRIAQDIADILVIVMPRHPNRGDEIAAMFTASGVKFAQRSKGDVISADHKVYLADTLGEAGLLYRLCDIAFVGNSLISVPGGGHNLLEPAHLNCAILHGPHMWNFIEIEAALREAGGSLMVPTSDDLAAQTVRLLRDVQSRQALADAAKAYVGAQGRVLDDVCGYLRPVLAKAGVRV